MPDAYTLDQLHRVIQLVFGWLDYHLYAFAVGDRRFEELLEEAQDEDSTAVRLRDLPLGTGARFTYTYDFGDHWVHEIVVEELYISTPLDRTRTRCRCSTAASGPDRAKTAAAPMDIARCARRCRSRSPGPRYVPAVGRRLRSRAVRRVDGAQQSHPGRGVGRDLTLAKHRRSGASRAARLRPRRSWLAGYRGKNLVRGYRKWFGVSDVCAVVELRMLGVDIPDTRLEQARRDESDRAAHESCPAKEKSRPGPTFAIGMTTFAFIVDYTEGGAPYGITWSEWEGLDVW